MAWAIDLVDSFYLFRWLVPSTLFGLLHAVLAGNVGCRTASDDWNGAVDVLADQPVLAALSTLPMWWSWSLCVCHAFTASLMVVAAQCFGLSGSDADRELVVDGRGAPRFGPGRPVLAPYVDNANALCWDQSDFDIYLAVLSRLVVLHQLAFRVDRSGSKSWTTDSIVLDASRKLVYNKPSRAWRLYGAVASLRQQRRISGYGIQTIFRHIFNVFLLFRPALSVLYFTYVLAKRHGDDVGHFYQPIDDELRPIGGTVLFTVSGADAESYPDAFSSDADEKGFAAHRVTLGSGVVADLARLREVRRGLSGMFSQSDLQTEAARGQRRFTGTRLVGARSDVACVRLVRTWRCWFRR